MWWPCTLPSFFTGRLIARFGETPSVLAGLALTAAAAPVGMSGQTVAHFVALAPMLGGAGTRLPGASAMVLQCHTPQEGPRVQSINDFVVFGTMVIGAFCIGQFRSAGRVEHRGRADAAASRAPAPRAFSAIRCGLICGRLSAGHHQEGAPQIHHR